MHGHDYLLLGTGNGTFNAPEHFPTLNLTNPVRRDVITLPKSNVNETTGGWAVIGFNLDNPGIWVPPLSLRLLTTDDSLSYCMACK
jgi:hypothetical protein